MTDSIQLICPSCTAINRVPAQRLADKSVCGKCRHALLDGKPVSATDSNFAHFVDHSGLPLVVDFWAPWCGPCQQFAPTFAQVAAEMKTRAGFVKLDTQANPQTANQFQIRSIPTLMLLQHGKEIARLSGALPKGQLVQWLNQQLATL